MLTLSRKYRMRQRLRRAAWWESLRNALLSSSMLYDSERESIGRMLSCDFSLLEPDVQFETDIAVHSTHTCTLLKYRQIIGRPA